MIYFAESPHVVMEGSGYADGKRRIALDSNFASPSREDPMSDPETHSEAARGSTETLYCEMKPVKRSEACEAERVNSSGRWKSLGSVFRRPERDRRSRRRSTQTVASPFHNPYLLTKLQRDDRRVHERLLAPCLRVFWGSLCDASHQLSVVMDKPNMQIPNSVVETAMRFRTVYDMQTATPNLGSLEVHAMMVMTGKLILHAKVTNQNTPRSHRDWGCLLMRMSFWCCQSHRGTSCALSPLYEKAVERLFPLGGTRTYSNVHSHAEYWQSLRSLAQRAAEDSDATTVMKDLAVALVTAGVAVDSRYLTSSEEGFGTECKED